MVRGLKVRPMGHLLLAISSISDTAVLPPEAPLLSITIVALHSGHILLRYTSDSVTRGLSLQGGAVGFQTTEGNGEKVPSQTGYGETVFCFGGLWGTYSASLPA